MRSLLLSLAFVSLCLVATEANSSDYYTELTADQDFLIKQKKINNLFYHVSQPDIVNPDLYKEGKDYIIEANINSYINQYAVNNFLKFHKLGFLPRGEIFSLFYPKLVHETKILFKLFFYAKDFETFYKTAAWARIYINEGQFIYALYQAVLRRPDTACIQLSPLYEFYPHAFFNSDVIEAAKNTILYNKINAVEGNSYIIRANYSGWYLDRDYNTEMTLKYFIEDIGLNAYYFFLRQNSPFWLESDEFGIEKSVRGEEYLYYHKTLYNRYNLERLANGLEKVEDFEWDSEFYPGYYPTMVYKNGLPFPHRPHRSKIPHYKHKYLHAVQAVERRISDAIDSGYVIDGDGKQIKIDTPEGINILGNIIEGNADSCNKDFYNSYEIIARKILGYNPQPKIPYRIVPSAMESYSSCLRDPAFYRLCERISYFYYQYKSHLNPYHKDEVIYPGLKFESVDVDRLVTYFDDFDATISNGLAVTSQKEAETLLLKVRQFRLNHKPFTVNFTLNSDIVQKVAIQMFLGPKYDAQHNLLDFTDSYKYFYEIDYWITVVDAGSNKLERNSHDFFFVRPDDEPSEIFYKRIEEALEGTEKLTYKPNIYGFPDRLLLPKGHLGGSPYQLFVFVSPRKNPILWLSQPFRNYEVDYHAMGYPLDRPIYRPHFDGPNIFFKDVNIFFESDVHPNSTS